MLYKSVKIFNVIDNSFWKPIGEKMRHQTVFKDGTFAQFGIIHVTL